MRDKVIALKDLLQKSEIDDEVVDILSNLKLRQLELTDEIKVKGEHTYVKVTDWEKEWWIAIKREGRWFNAELIKDEKKVEEKNDNPVVNNEEIKPQDSQGNTELPNWEKLEDVIMTTIEDKEVIEKIDLDNNSKSKIDISVNWVLTIDWKGIEWIAWFDKSTKSLKISDIQEWQLLIDGENIDWTKFFVIVKDNKIMESWEWEFNDELKSWELWEVETTFPVEPELKDEPEIIKPIENIEVETTFPVQIENVQEVEKQEPSFIKWPNLSTLNNKWVVEWAKITLKTSLTVRWDNWESTWLLLSGWTDAVVLSNETMQKWEYIYANVKQWNKEWWVAIINKNEWFNVEKAKPEVREKIILNNRLTQDTIYIDSPLINEPLKPFKQIEERVFIWDNVTINWSTYISNTARVSIWSNYPWVNSNVSIGGLSVSWNWSVNIWWISIN